MKNYRIALLPADGIGPELTDSVKKVLSALETPYDLHFDLVAYPIAKAALELCGDQLPPETLEGIRRADAALMATPAVSQLPPPSVVGRLRKELGLYADVRTARLPDKNLDLVFVRECTEGFLADRNMFSGRGEMMPTQDCALSMRVVTRAASERIARFALEYAVRNGRKRITVAHKKAVLPITCGLFVDCVKHIAKEYPAITLDDCSVDTLANRLVRAPQEYDMILSTNLFGDILSDVGAVVADDMMATCNLGDEVALFSQVNHDPRFAEAGRGTVDPRQLLLCAGMLLRHLGLAKAGSALENAVLQTRAEQMAGAAAITQAVLRAMTNAQ